MLINKMDELFEKIKETTHVEDIGYHQVIDGRLNPMYKSKTGELSLEEWKAIHVKNPVFIKDNPILQEAIIDKKTIVISDLKIDNRSTKDVFLFGIDSIMIIPIIRNDDVIGIVPIVSIGKTHKFSEDEVDKCRELIEYYKEFL